jgi:hypothetical protein
MSEAAVDEIERSQRDAIAAISRPGDWLTGEQRVDAWRHVRAAATDELDAARRSAVSPFAVEGSHGASDHLEAAAVEVVHRVASDPGRLTRAWAQTQIDAIGEEMYTELVGVVAIAMVVDRFHRALGRPEPDPPQPVVGDPARERPDDVGDVGAWVSQSTGPTAANVSRTLSLVPVTNGPWRDLVNTHYSRGAEFMSTVWQRPLSRPQVEVVASRTTTWNECFY